eukprot:3840762-Pleurochrysis_carterae.AAC.1
MLTFKYYPFICECRISQHALANLNSSMLDAISAMSMYDECGHAMIVDVSNGPKTETREAINYGVLYEF